MNPSTSPHSTAALLVEAEVGAQKSMFDGRPLDKDIAIVTYDLPRERFLIAIDDEQREDPELIIVSDWRPEFLGSQLPRK